MVRHALLPDSLHLLGFHIYRSKLRMLTYTQKHATAS